MEGHPDCQLTVRNSKYARTLFQQLFIIINCGSVFPLDTITLKYFFCGFLSAKISRRESKIQIKRSPFNLNHQQ